MLQLVILVNHACFLFFADQPQHVMSIHGGSMANLKSFILHKHVYASCCHCALHCTPEKCLAKGMPAVICMMALPFTQTFVLTTQVVAAQAGNQIWITPT